MLTTPHVDYAPARRAQRRCLERDASRHARATASRLCTPSSIWERPHALVTARFAFGPLAPATSRTLQPARTTRNGHVPDGGQPRLRRETLSTETPRSHLLAHDSPHHANELDATSPHVHRPRTRPDGVLHHPSMHVRTNQNAFCSMFYVGCCLGFDLLDGCSDHLKD